MHHALGDRAHQLGLGLDKGVLGLSRVAAGDATQAKDAFIEAQSELMRAVSKGVVHKNTGSRKVSRLAARLKKLAAA